jgi:phosphoenolpyruvate carboxykinase (GTP)
VRRDPMAMLPFCGYNMADYWQHWLNMEKLIKNPPKIFNVNWFRVDDKGNYEWPGFGENFRVLEWILKRCFDEADAVESPIGFMPRPEDLNTEGLDVPADTLKDLLTIDKEVWRQEAAGIREFYSRFGEKLPKALEEELTVLENNLK